MKSRRAVSFFQHTFIREYPSPNNELSSELFYQKDDYARFHQEERQRWERAYAKRLSKANVEKQQSKSELETRIQQLKDGAEIQRHQEMASQDTSPQTVKRKMASAA